MYRMYRNRGSAAAAGWTAGLTALAALVLLTPGAAGAQGAADASGTLKVGVIDVGRLLEESAAGKAAVASVRDLQQAKTVEAKKIQEEGEALKERIEQGRLSLSEEALADLQKQLEDKAIALQRLQADAQRELQAAEQNAFAELQRRVMPVIEAVGREGGFTFLFNKFDSGLVYAADGVDVTDLLLERFDALTAAAAASAPATQGK